MGVGASEGIIGRVWKRRGKAEGGESEENRVNEWEKGALELIDGKNSQKWKI